MILGCGHNKSVGYGYDTNEEYADVDRVCQS